MKHNYVTQLASTAAFALSASYSAFADLTLLGPTPYLSFADSPFAGLSLSPFYLEDFEDGVLNMPGVTAISNTPGTTGGIFGPGSISDSVDGDDGAIDGSGRGGHGFAETSNQSSDNLGYTFSFSAAVLGSFPTHVGLVWTDGSQTASTQFEVYGPTGSLLGIIGPVKISDNSFEGGTAEDRFFGAVNSDGISRVVIRSPGGNNNLEIDHLQANVPEPSSVVLILSGMFGLLVRRRHAKTSTFQ